MTTYSEDATSQDDVDPSYTANPDADRAGDSEEDEQFDREYVEKLRKENARYRTAARENANAAKELEQLKHKDASAEDRAAAAEKRAEEAEARVLRREIAIEEKLDKDDVDFLDLAADEDTIRRLAKRLARSASTGGSSDSDGSKPRVGAKPSSNSRGTGVDPGNSAEQRGRTLFGV